MSDTEPASPFVSASVSVAFPMGTAQASLTITPGRIVVDPGAFKRLFVGDVGVDQRGGECFLYRGSRSRPWIKSFLVVGGDEAWARINLHPKLEERVVDSLRRAGFTVVEKSGAAPSLIGRRASARRRDAADRSRGGDSLVDEILPSYVAILFLLGLGVLVLSFVLPQPDPPVAYPAIPLLLGVVYGVIDGRRIYLNLEAGLGIWTPRVGKRWATALATTVGIVVLLLFFLGKPPWFRAALAVFALSSFGTTALVLALFLWRRRAKAG